MGIMFTILFQGKTTTEVSVERESTLLSAAAKGGLKLTHQCGGHARCGSCRVTVRQGMENLSPAGNAESRVLKVLKSEPSHRLACQSWASGDVSCEF